MRITMVPGDGSTLRSANALRQARLEPQHHLVILQPEVPRYAAFSPAGWFA